MEIKFNIEKKIMLVLLAAICIVLAIPLIIASPATPGVSHPADEIEPGPFAAGDYSFPGTSRVGIGTTGPNRKLEVRGDSDGIRLATDSSPSAYYAELIANYNSNTAFQANVHGYTFLQSGADASNTRLNAQSGDLRLQVAGSDKVTILGNGNVGIGTTSPGQKLDVAGKIEISNDATAATAGAIRWTGTDFEGYDGSAWNSLTSGGGGGGSVGRIVSGTFSRQYISANPDQVTTGIGFRPKAILFLVNTIYGTSPSVGFVTETGDYGMSADEGPSALQFYSTKFHRSDAGTEYVYGELKSMDADGFTTTWTTGAGADSTITVYYLAFEGGGGGGGISSCWDDVTQTVAPPWETGNEVCANGGGFCMLQFLEPGSVYSCYTVTSGMRVRCCR